MKENTKILKNFFHVINFLYFARDNFTLPGKEGESGAYVWMDLIK